MGKVTARSFQFLLRMPDGMREVLKARADQNERSVNAEIIILLEAGLAGEAHDDQRLARIEAKLDQALSTAQPSQRSA